MSTKEGDINEAMHQLFLALDAEAAETTYRHVKMAVSLLDAGTHDKVNGVCIYENAGFKVQTSLSTARAFAAAVLVENGYPLQLEADTAPDDTQAA